MKYTIQRTTLAKLSAFVAALLSLGQSAQANTVDNVNNGSSDLTAAATYSGGLPTTTNDVVFTAVPYSPSAFTLNPAGYNLSVGTLDDLSSTPLTIQNTVAGSYSTITLNGGVNSAPGSATGDLLFVATGANLTVGGGSGGAMFLAVAAAGNLDIAGSATLNGTLVGTTTGATASASLTKTGTGTLDLAGGSLRPMVSAVPSLYTGVLTISNGAIELSNTTALEGAEVSNSVANGLVFDSAVTSHTFDVGSLAGAGAIALTDTASNAVNLVLTQNSFGLNSATPNTTYSGVLSGTAGSLTKLGSYTQTLSGANTYTGATSVNGGTLTVSGSLASTALNLGGGTYNDGLSTGTQTFTTTTVNPGNSAVTTANAADTLNLGAITRNADSTLDFGATGTITATGLTNTNGIIGGWATDAGQTTFAVAPASAGAPVTGLATASYTSSATAGTTASAYANANIDMLASEVITGGTISANAIRFNTSTTSTLTLSTGTNTILSGGIMSTSAATAANTITGGSLTSGTQELDITGGKSTTITSTIVDNANGAVAVVLSGAGLNLGAADSYTGGTFVNSGTLTLGGGATSAGSGTITLGSVGSSASAYIVTSNSVNYANAITVNPGGNRAIYTSGSPAPTFSGLATLVGGATLGVGANGGGSFTFSGGVQGTGNFQVGSPISGRTANATVSGGAINISGTFSDRVNAGGDQAGYVLVSAPVIGNTAILQDSATNQFVFTGINTNSGPTTISAGILQVGGTSSGGTTLVAGAAGATGSLSASSPIVDNGTLVIDRTGTLTLGAGISGTGALTLYGTGTTVLTAANTYTGTTSITTNANNATAGTLQLGNGGTTGSLSASSAIVDNGTFAINRSNTVTEGTDFAAASSFTGTGGLSQIGTGTTVLSGANSYTGTTAVNLGTLQLNFAAAGSPATNIVSASSVLALGGGTLNLLGNSGATNSQTFASTTVNAGSSAITFTQNGATGLSLVLGTITRNTGGVLDVTLPTAGTVTAGSSGIMGGLLASSSTNGVAYATANGGSTWLANTGGTLSAFSGYVTGNANYLIGNNVDVANGNSVANVTVNTLRFNAATDALTTGTLTVNAGGILVTAAATNASISGGTLTANATGKELVVIDNGVLTINSIIANSGSNAVALTLAGSGTTTLTAANTFTGATTINSGSVDLENSLALQNSSVTVGSTGHIIFDSSVATNSFTFGGLSGSGNLALVNNAATPAPINLSVGNSVPTNGSFAGVLSGAGSLTKVGTNTQTLSGINTYTGTTTITAGTLQIGGAGSLGSGAYAANITDNGTLEYSSTASQTLSGIISGTGAITQDTSSTGVLILSNANTYSGLTTVTLGTLDLANQNAALDSIVTMSGGTLAFDQSVTGKAFNVAGLSGSGNIALVNNASTPAAIALSVGYNGATNPSYSGALTGAGSLTKVGSNTQILSGVNTYTGATTVNAGTLEFSGGSDLNTAITINSGAFVQFAFGNGGGTQTSVTGALTGQGGVIDSEGNPNTSFTMNQANTYTGSTIINNRGILKAGVGSVQSGGAYVSGPFGVDSALVVDSTAIGAETVWLNGLTVEVGSLASLGSVGNTSTSGFVLNTTTTAGTLGIIPARLMGRSSAMARSQAAQPPAISERSSPAACW